MAHVGERLHGLEGFFADQSHNHFEGPCYFSTEPYFVLAYTGTTSGQDWGLMRGDLEFGPPLPHYTSNKSEGFLRCRSKGFRCRV